MRGGFGPLFITSLLDENQTWNPTWQVWIMLVRIIGGFFGTTLEGRHDGICDDDLGYH